MSSLNCFLLNCLKAKKKPKPQHVTFITLLDFYYIIRFKNQDPTLNVVRYLQGSKGRGKMGVTMSPPQYLLISHFQMWYHTNFFY